MFQKDPAKESQPPSRDDAVSSLGGGPPTGWGIHEDEEHYWQEPIYRVHPLSNRLEAVGGLFHRFWVEHVEQLLQMKADGWPHEDIQDVAEELRQRQIDAYDEQKKLIEAGKEQRTGQVQDNIAEAFNRFPQDEPIPEMGKAVSHFILKIEKADPSVGGQRTLTPQEAKVNHSQSFSRRPQGITNAATTPNRENEEEEAPAPVLVFAPQGVTQ